MLEDLAVTPISETLHRLSAERRSGDLQVRSGKIAKTVFFDHGRIVFAGSNLKKDRLGEALIALGRITDEDAQRAQAFMKGDRRRRFGDALVQAGILDKNELGRSVARQVRRIVLSLFTIDSGAVSFEDRQCAIPLEYMVSLSIHRLLYDGIRLCKNRELILAGLGSLDRWVTMNALPPFPFEPKECSPDERDVLEQSTRRVTIRRLAWSGGALALPRLKAVYAFLASGVLKDADEVAEEAPQPIVQMETSTFLLSALRRQPDPSSHQAILQEVQEELARSARLDRESWLKVSRTAPREELVKALEDKMERYHALLDAVGEDQNLKNDIELILGRASSMLRLARQGPTEAAKSAAAAKPAVEAKPAEAPAPPAPPTSQASVPSFAGEMQVDHLLMEAHVRMTVSDQASVPSFAGEMQVDHLLMEAHVRMTVSDYANAVKTYAKLVDLAPNVATYRTLLAIAMACYPRTAKQAEREFFEGVRLDPNNPDIHYQFGLYYKSMRQRTRAVAEFRTAVRLNPRHKAAREELEGLSPKDSSLLSLKKIFK